MKNILFFTIRTPIPNVSGGETWIYNIAKELSKNNELNILLLSFYEPQFKYYETAYSLLLNSIFKKTYYLKYNNRIFNNLLPRNVNHVFSKENLNTLMEIIKKEKIDIVHFFSQDLLVYSKYLKGSKKIYTEIDISYIDPVKTYLKNQTVLKNLLESYKYRFFLSRFMKSMNAITYISKEDWNIMKDFIPTKPKNIHTPNSLNTELYKSKKQAASRGKNIYFIGNYLHKPNTDALKLLVFKIFPKLKRKIPNLKFHVIGPFLPKNLKSKITDPDIIVTGYIKNHIDYLKKMDLMIAPIKTGKGIKTKILESFLLKIPVIGYKEAFSGLSEIEDINFFSCSTQSELLNKSEEVLKNKTDITDFLNRISENIEKNYDIKLTAQKILKLYTEL